jgi:NAD(P)-dependent dehydrogenase (short-subunit alcohol dehydrogenase family)
MAVDQFPIALVTGAGRGIGRATAVALAGVGYRVALLSRTRRELEDTASLVVQAGSQALVLAADVSDENQVREAFSTLVREWGDLSILVNNAGWARFHRIEDTPLCDWNATIGVTLTGVFLCSREAIPSLVRSGGGIIVNISSCSGIKGYLEQGAYVAAKHGVQGLSKVLAMELKQQGIRVHAICPGAVDTQMADEIHPSRDRSGWMTPTDVADVVRFLVTRPSHFTIDEIVMRRFLSDVMF